MNHNYHETIAACTSYSTCGILMTLQEINWATVGAVVLLCARLAKDVPDAYDSVIKRLADRKERKKQNDQGNR